MFRFVSVIAFLILVPGQISAEEQPSRTIGLSGSRSTARSNAAASDRPAWPVIEKAIRGKQPQEKGYQPGDLITRQEGTAILKELKRIKWPITPDTQITDRMLPKNDEMLRLLRSKRGLDFMRNISRFPGGYDRLDKMRGLPDGSKRLREIVTEPGGSKLIEYLATTRGGRNMGRQLSRGGQRDFNAPTNRIYTIDDLIAALQTIYQAETAEKEKTGKR